MGNSNGNFQEYWDLVERERQMQGGFIWDWMDQGLADTKNGKKFWAYGGHYEPKGQVHTNNFCLNGVIDADHTPHPGLFEVKKVYSNIGFSADATQITVSNKRFFTDLSDCIIKWDLVANGKIIKVGQLRPDGVAPQTQKSFPINLGTLPQNKEVFLNVYALNKDNTSLLAFGHEIGREQIQLKKTPILAPISNSNEKLVVNNDDESITIEGINFTISFSKNNAALSSYIINGANIITSPMVPTFWRAPTDNDYGNKLPSRSAVWKNAVAAAQVKSIESTQVSDTEVRLHTELILPTVEGLISINYNIYGDGQIDVDYSFIANKKGLAEIPRIGMVMQLPKSMDDLHYYGRGPWENYSDRKTAAFIGSYNGKVSDQFFSYSRPQENGHKTDVRCLSLSNPRGLGIKVVAQETPIEFNALHYSTEILDEGAKKRLRTPADISEGDFVELHIDHKMMGLGGDNSWGAKPHKPYMMYADKEYTYKFSLIPIK